MDNQVQHEAVFMEASRDEIIRSLGWLLLLLAILVDKEKSTPIIIPMSKYINGLISALVLVEVLTFSDTHLEYGDSGS